MLTISFTFLSLFLFVYTSQAAPTTKDIWAVSIFRDPAPPPAKGPSASAHALRDPSKLKYEIIGIVGAYIVWLTITALAVFLVGRKFKRKSQDSDHTFGMDTIKSTGQVGIREIEAGPKSPLSPKSPGKLASLKSWARGNKANRQSDHSISTIDSKVVDSDKARNMDEMAKLYAAVMVHDQQKAQSSAGSSPILENESPVTPTSLHSHQDYHATSYPTHEISDHMAPLQPPPTNDDRASLLSNQSPPRKTKNVALSIMSNSSRLGSSNSSKPRPSPITLRGQPISKPLGSADPRQSAFSNSQTSLPSTVYSPGRAPPTPGTKTPGTAVTAIDEIEMQGVAQMTNHPGDSVTSVPRTLPFRQYYQESLRSAPPTKTTFVDRKAALNGPKTGVPQTPYSPYCPSTPMTPITPRRLLTRDDLKKQKKQQALKVVRETDIVQSDNDMWGTD